MTKLKCSTSTCALDDAAGELDVEAIRKMFPIFRNRKGWIFFDNAATSQKPANVLQKMTQFYRRDCANAGRASYRLSTRASGLIELARQRVAGFINATTTEIVFTNGATDSLNTIALAWGLTNLKSGDEIMVCYEDHKSAVLPWFNVKRLLAGFGIEITITPITLHREGDYELKNIREQVNGRTRLIAISHVHHLYGLDMEVEKIREIVGRNVLISLDASQSVGHRRVDVKLLDVDFLSFSGHKMFAANGVGVLWVSAAVHKNMVAIKSGGKTPGYVNAAGFGLNKLRSNNFGPGETGTGKTGTGKTGTGKTGSDEPEPATALAAFLESGTQDVAAIVSLQAAIDFIETLGIDNIEAHVSKLSHYLYDQLKLFPGIEFAPGFGRCGCPIGYGIISFRFEHIATVDLAFLLDSENILLRTGDHCLTSRLDGDDYARVSLHVYNTEAEIDHFLEVLRSNLT